MTNELNHIVITATHDDTVPEGAQHVIYAGSTNVPQRIDITMKLLYHLLGTLLLECDRPMDKINDDLETLKAAPFGSIIRALSHIVATETETTYSPTPLLFALEKAEVIKSIKEQIDLTLTSDVSGNDASNIH